MTSFSLRDCLKSSWLLCRIAKSGSFHRVPAWIWQSRRAFRRVLRQSLKVIQFFQALLIPVFLLGGAVRLVTSERFLEFEYTRRVYNSLLMLMGAAPLVLDTQIMPYLVSIYLF